MARACARSRDTRAAAAVDTLNDSIDPYIGIDTNTSHRALVEAREPAALGAEHEHERLIGELEVEQRPVAARRRGRRSNTRARRARSSAAGIPPTTRDREVLERAGRGLGDGRRDRRGCGAAAARDRSRRRSRRRVPPRRGCAGRSHRRARRRTRRVRPAARRGRRPAAARPRATTPCGASVRASASMRSAPTTFSAEPASSRISSSAGSSRTELDTDTLRTGRRPARSSSSTARRPSTCSPPSPARAGRDSPRHQTLRQIVPFGVSSSWMPRASSSSRMRSAPAQSLFVRASSRWRMRSATSLSTSSSASDSARPSAAASERTVATEPRRVVETLLVERGVGVATKRLQHCDRRGRVEVVVHRVAERLGGRRVAPPAARRDARGGAARRTPRRPSARRSSSLSSRLPSAGGSASSARACGRRAGRTGRARRRAS